ncbi:hypothetical protein [Salipaludibacillus daqingensis]|uniref:hypothetical protein n=1 Tax=Salipaludibacillus daqingensis TaxID=3041001 RepID=UPI0024737982|nr:hypothetical protein [Salipaludibacillus daqingensis]
MKIKTELAELQPSQLYLDRTKLRNLIMNGYDAEQTEKKPLPVIKLNGELVLVGSHTRAFLADQQGETYVTVEYLAEIDNLSNYQTYVSWCKEEDITKVSDLGKQIISSEDFEREWVDRCNRISQK